MTERQDKIRKLVWLRPYLTELSGLVGRNVGADELLPIEETMLLREKLKLIPKEQVVRSIFSFKDRKSRAFAKMIEQLQVLNGSPVVLWPPKANDCGLLPLPSLMDINFGFSFDLISDELLFIATRDGCDSMLLDFSEEEDESQSLEIELHGLHWSQATLSLLD